MNYRTPKELAYEYEVSETTVKCFSSILTTSNFINVQKIQSTRAELLWPIKLINLEMEIVKDLAEVWIALSDQDSL